MHNGTLSVEVEVLSLFKQEVFVYCIPGSLWLEPAFKLWPFLHSGLKTPGTVWWCWKIGGEGRREHYFCDRTEHLRLLVKKKKKKKNKEEEEEEEVDDGTDKGDDESKESLKRILTLSLCNTGFRNKCKGL